LTREDGTLVFGLGDSLPNPAKPVRETGLAPIAGHARLQSRQTVIFAAAAEMNAASPLQLEAYHAGAPFFALGVQPPAGIWRRQQLEVMTSSAGHLLEIDHVTRTGSRRRVSVFLSDDGTDLRYEERAEMSGCASLELTLPLGASVSTTQGGLGALITFGKLASWQLLVRGGHVQAHGSILTITPDARETACLNFALRAAAKKSRKANPKANDGSGARQLL
jgi:hypothetical protein